MVLVVAAYLGSMPLQMVEISPCKRLFVGGCILLAPSKLTMQMFPCQVIHMSYEFEVRMKELANF